MNDTHQFSEKCFCNGNQAIDRFGNPEGFCNSMEHDPIRKGQAKYWCFVDADSNCVDKHKRTTDSEQMISFHACAGNS